MALFLVLFNRCRVPLFPVRESPFSKWARAKILMSGWLFNVSLPFASSSFRKPRPGSALVLFQVQSLLTLIIIKTSFFSFSPISHLILLIERE